MNAIVRLRLLLPTTLLLLSSPAQAQNFDHLTCFKVKDPQKTSASVDLDAQQSAFDLPAGCNVSKAKLYCTPTEKTVNSLEVNGAPVSPLPIAGITPADSRVCYKIKCPVQEIADQVVTDQFGSRTLSKFKTSLLCTPALLGPPPTTSTTTTTTSSTTTTSTTTTSTTTTTLLVGCGSLMSEDFSDNSLGWTLGPLWQIGASAQSSGQQFGNPDPAVDHSLSIDNGVAGVVIGGNYTTTIHPFYYLESPPIGTAGAASLSLEFWRWLNSDYPPYITNTVEVSNNGGANWFVVWTSPNDSMYITDNSWTQQTFDLTPYLAPTIRVRFGFDVNQLSPVLMSGWNVDDVVLTGCE